MSVVISGYYGFGNVGDEVILAALVEALRGRLSVDGDQIVVLSATPQETAQTHGVRAVDRWNPRAIRRELRRAKAFIAGGGGLIQDETSCRSALYYLGLIDWARHHCPVFLMGQGIGPLKGSIARAWARRILPRVEMAMVRDGSSETLLRRWRLPEGRLVRGGDLSLLLWPCWESHRRRICAPPPATADVAESGDGCPYLAVCLKGRHPRSLQRGMARAFDRLCERRGLRIVFLSLHPEEDRATMEGIARRMSSPSLVLDPGGVALDEVIACIGGAKAVGGMRLHALLFALLTGRPFVALGVDPKVESFLRQVREAGGPQLPCWTLEQVGCRRLHLSGALSDFDDCSEETRAQLLQAGERLYRQTERAVQIILDGLARWIERGGNGP